MLASICDEDVWTGVLQCSSAGAAWRERMLPLRVCTWRTRGGCAGRVRAARVGAVRVSAPARRRLRFDNERPHIDFPLTPIASRPQNATVGRCRTMSTQVTESRYKSTVKTKARKTNNHASFGGSLL